MGGKTKQTSNSTQTNTAYAPVKPVIDRRYTLDELPEAMRYLGLGRTRGKCVVALPWSVH